MSLGSRVSPNILGLIFMERVVFILVQVVCCSPLGLSWSGLVGLD